MNLSWVQNPLFTLSGWLIGVAGLIAAFYYGIKGKSKKELSYMIVQSEQLISSEKNVFQNSIFFLKTKKFMILL